jgi:hypothetical protein
VVLDDEEGDAFGAQRAEVIGDGFGETWIDAGDGLVEQDEARLGHQRAADFEELLLAARERGGRVVDDGGQVEALGDGVGLVERGAGGAATEQCGEEALAGLVGGVEEQVVENGEARDAAGDLEGAGQARPGDAVGAPGGDVASVEADLAAVGRDDAGDALEQRGLAGAVGADQRGDRAGLDVEIGAGERADAVEGAGQPSDF